MAQVSGLLSAFGDSVAQLCESTLDVQSPNKRGVQPARPCGLPVTIETVRSRMSLASQYNVMRTVRMTVFGTCCGPLLMVWYRTLATV